MKVEFTDPEIRWLLGQLQDMQSRRAFDRGSTAYLVLVKLRRIFRENT